MCKCPWLPPVWWLTPDKTAEQLSHLSSTLPWQLWSLVPLLVNVFGALAVGEEIESFLLWKLIHNEKLVQTLLLVLSFYYELQIVGSRWPEVGPGGPNLGNGK